MSDDQLTYGIDYGARKVAVAGLYRSNIVVLTDIVLTTGVTAVNVLPMLVDFVENAMSNTAKPGLVALEAPIVGGSGAAQTAIKMAMVAGAIAYHLRSRFIQVVMPPPGTWKKISLGHGNASKVDVMQWAGQNWPGQAKTEDQADALGLAVYANHYLNQGEHDE